MDVGQYPVVLTVGDDASAIGALARRSDFGRGTAVGAVGDGVALLSWVGLKASLAVEDHYVFHVPVTVGVALKHFLRGVINNVVAHHGAERNG